ncbi:MAG: biopolymer transporter ExbD [Bdellovibrionaceae bacterium]|nr:biopolymer transporter ExbD [Pseudobdellovibrionaceae bacterium]
MIKDTILESTALESPLKAASQIKPKTGGLKKNLVASVILTSLIDAFSILVIYLLVNFSNTGEILYLSKDMELPQSEQSEVLQRTTLVKIEKGQMYIEDKPIEPSELVERLVEIKKSLTTEGKYTEDMLALTLQADRRIKYNEMSQVIQAGSHAGFSEIKFAVLAN